MGMCIGPNFLTASALSGSSPRRQVTSKIYRTAPFSMTLNNPYPQFQGHPVFDAEYLRNGTTYTHSFNKILIGTNTQHYHFEWSWVTLSDLAKYSMTRSVTRSLCDNWASCFELHCNLAIAVVAIPLSLATVVHHSRAWQWDIFTNCQFNIITFVYDFYRSAYA